LLVVKDAAIAAASKNATAQKYRRKRLNLRELVRTTEILPMMLLTPAIVKIPQCIMHCKKS